MAKHLILLLCAFMAVNASAQKYDPYLSYPEVEGQGFPSSAWELVAEEVTAGFTGTDVRPAKAEPYMKLIEPTWHSTAWRGDKVHNQFIVQAKNGAGYIEAMTGELVSASGKVIPAENVSVSLVRYVLTDGLNSEGCGCGIPPASEFVSSLSADAIDVTAAGTMDKMSVQPFWLSVTIPTCTVPDTYQGTVKVMVDGEELQLPYTIEVKDWTLPQADKRQYHLDLWQNPYSVARYHGVPLWSKQHFELLSPYMEMLAAAGQKTITVSMIYDPWQSQTYDVYGSMIKWIKGRDGSWRYDYSVFDQWVGFMMSLGIDRLVNCYSMVPWNNKFYYHDEATGRDTVLVAKTGTPEYEAHWEPMLRDFTRHLKQKGWFDVTAIAMDERPVEAMQAVIRLVKRVEPDFKISLAGSWHPEIEQDIYDYCIASAEVFPAEVFRKRNNAGLPTTFYTYCYEGRPNTFTFSPPAEAEWMAWYGAATGFNGYLRWAYNCWPEFPLQDSRYSTWSGGDTYLVYPGPRSSVRFERLVEGVRSYEKIRLLREYFKTTGDNVALERIDKMLAPFGIVALGETPASDMINEAKRILDSF